MQLIETEDLIIFNWHEASVSGDLQTQLVSVLDGMEQTLRGYGVPFSAMLKHTIAIREGMVDALAAIHGFHRHCHALAPQLRAEPSVGTIFRVPRFAREDTMMAVEAVFAKFPQGINRVLFEDIEMDVARALDYRGRIFLTGFEALELLQPEHGLDAENRQVRESLTEQVEVVLDKIDSSLKRLGADCSMLNRLSLYLRDDQDPAKARQLVCAAVEKRARTPLSDDFHLFVLRGHGMVMDSFKIEIDGVAQRLDVVHPAWVSLCCGQRGSVNDGVMQQAAKTLAAQLSPMLKQSPRGLQVVLKHVDPGLSPDAVGRLLNTFASALDLALGGHAPAQLSLALLRVNALLETDTAIELDASVFIS